MCSKAMLKKTKSEYLLGKKSKEDLIDKDLHEINFKKKSNKEYKSLFKDEFELPSMKARTRLKTHFLIEDLFIKNKKIFESINSEYKDLLKLINKEKININYSIFPKKFNFDNFKFLDVSKLDYNDTLSYYSIVIFLSEIKLSYFSYKQLTKETHSFDFIKFN